MQAQAKQHQHKLTMNVIPPMFVTDIFDQYYGYSGYFPTFDPSDKMVLDEPIPQFVGKIL